MKESPAPIQKARIAILATLAYLTMLSYAVARNPIDSLFLQQNSVEGLPLAWVLTAIGAALTIAVYNRYNAKSSMLKIFSAAGVISITLLAAILLLFDISPVPMSYVLYVWKEMYIVVLVEIFWSYADIVFSIKSARWIYGVLLACGSLGGMTGSLLIGPAAKAFGTQNTLWLLVPILALCCFVAQIVGKKLGDPVPALNAHKKNSMSGGLNVLRNSKYLVPLLFVVLIVQMTTALVDYSYNGFLQNTFPDLDTRTDMMSKIHATVDLVAVTLQIGTGFVLRWIGVAGALLSVPTLVGAALAGFFIYPQVLMIIAARLISKSLDYSIFRAAKEILYIPLNRAEKTQGKAIIDILAYRFGKGTSSIILMGLIELGLSDYSMHLAFFLAVVWLLLTFIIAKRYRSLVSFTEEQALHGKVKAA